MPKPRWTSATFLLYLGAFTVLLAAGSAYSYLSLHYGKAAFVGWTLLMLAVLGVIALFFRHRRAWITGGLFAYLSVSAFGVFVGALFEWFGWNGPSRHGLFGGWHWSEWAAIVLILAASFVALRRFRFPLLVFPICLLVWVLVTDVISGGGSWSAVVSLCFGLLYLLVALAANRVYAFWIHVASGLLLGGSLLYWWHSSTADWWLLAIAGVVFIRLGSVIRRSSWAVIGAIGLFAAATHFAVTWARIGFLFFQGDGSGRAWAPILVAAVLGFLFVLLGLWAARRDPLPVE